MAKQSKKEVTHTVKTKINCVITDIKISATDVQTGETFPVSELNIAQHGHARLITAKPVNYCMACGPKVACMSPLVHTAEYRITLDVGNLNLVISPPPE